ncbi:MAG: carbamoyltransferase N-terminal domain-containing protein [Planctomycetota bacterium]
MNILGISCFYHDAAAAVIKDGKLAAALQEERFTREKNTAVFPRQAISRALEIGGLTIGDLDYVVFYEKPFIKLERILSTHLAVWPRSLGAFLEFLPEWAKRKLHIPAMIRSETGFEKSILFVEHHLAHAAAAFLVSPFEEAAILTYDGVGEWTTALRGVGRGLQIETFDEIHFPHSLGLLYSAVTGYLGFRVLSGEGNVMGLAPYGRPRYLDKLRQVLHVAEDGSFALDLSYFRFHYGTTAGLMVNRAFERLMGHPPRRPSEEVEQHHADIASSLQAILEDTVIRLARDLHTRTGLKHLCLAGGVALNAVANSRILSETPFERIFVQPAAGDAGAALGAAAYVLNSVLGHPRFEMEHAYTGTEYPDAEIESFLRGRAVEWRRFNDRAELLRETASLLARDEIVGWFQGRMEYGGRALGARSILASPMSLEMKRKLNLKVKHRENHCTFAPVVPCERLMDYFETSHPSPFMLLVAPVRREVREIVPTVTHVDGSARIQTLERRHHPLFYDLLEEFGKQTGVPILVNTSFNTRGQPIVESPKDAYECFASTRMDHLLMGSYLVSKPSLGRSWNASDENGDSRL